MIRITGGELNGRTIRAPEGDKTRPTGSKVRSAIFDMLQADVPDAAFVDLCCGAGTVGIEALSRGAAHVTFVEQHRRTVGLLRANLESLGIAPERFTVAATAAQAWAESDEEAGDIVFCDPPYRSEVLTRLLPTLAARGKISPGGWLVVETAKDADLRAIDLDGLTLERERRHGDTTLWLWRAQGGA